MKNASSFGLQKGWFFEVLTYYVFVCITPVY